MKVLNAKHTCLHLPYLAVLFFWLQVFAVRSGGATGVVVKGPDDKSSVAFRFVWSFHSSSSKDKNLVFNVCVCTVTLRRIRRWGGVVKSTGALMGS